MRFTTILPKFALKKKEQLAFHMPGEFPVNVGIPIWMKYFPADYKGLVIRCEKNFLSFEGRKK